MRNGHYNWKVTNRAASHNGPHLVSASFSFLRRPRTFFVRFFSPDANRDDMRTHFAGYKAQYDIINIIVCITKTNRAEDVRLTYRNWEIDQEHKHPAFFSGEKKLLLIRSRLNPPSVSLHSLRKMERRCELRLINVSTSLATFWGGVERDLSEQAASQTGCRDLSNTDGCHSRSSRQNQRKVKSWCVSVWMQILEDWREFCFWYNLSASLEKGCHEWFQKHPFLKV